MNHTTSTHSTVLRCPDCTATADAGEVLRHVYSCPIATADRVQLRDDLTWLRKHPDAGHRARPATLAEQEHLRLTGIDADTTRRLTVLVRRAAPGARLLLHVVDGAVIAASADLGGVAR